MKRIFFGALGLLALASCSNDELTSINHDGNEITFGVVTNSISRADTVYCNNHFPKNFNVWATYNNKEYISNDFVQKQEDNTWKNMSGNRYWPDGEVTFFAYHDAGESNAGTFNYNSGSPKITNFKVKENVGEQNDLVYAVKKQSKPTDGKVTLNFRHALSQIVFMAKNENPNLYVEIYGVSVCNVLGEGEFAYPTSGTTDNNMEDKGSSGSTAATDHDGTFTPSNASISGTGTWTLSGNKTKYSVDVTTSGSVGSTPVKLNGSKTATAVSLTNNGSGEEFSNKAMLLLPQTTDAWTPTSGSATANGQEGSYFLVKCEIFNVAGASYNSTNDVCLWGKNDATTTTGKEVAIPVKFEWTQGKKYIYTFVFGDGNGGYDPGQTDTPVLLPVTFNVTVDDFVSATQPNTDMNTTVAASGSN